MKKILILAIPILLFSILFVGIYFTISPFGAKKMEPETLIPPKVSEEKPATLVLENTSWVWEKTIMNDDSTITPPVEKFVLTLNAREKTFQSTTDCNSISGTFSYEKSSNSVTFGEIASTLMACPESVEEEYVKQLQSVDSLLLRDSKLYLQLKYDSGSMVFSPKE